MGMKLQYLDTIPTSCAVLYTHHKTLHTHISLFIATKRMHDYTPKRLSTEEMSRIANKGLVAFDLPLIFLCSLIQTQTLTPPPNNALLAILDMYTTALLTLQAPAGICIR